MILEFKVFKLKEDSILYNQSVQDNPSKINEFIIVGEEKLSEDYDCYKAHQLGEDGFKLLGGLDIDRFSLLIPKKDLIPSPGLGVETIEFDIPKKHLTMDIIENIQRLNAL